MIRKAIIVVLTLGAVGIGVVEATTFFMPLWWVWESKPASLAVYVGDGAVETRYRTIKPGKTTPFWRHGGWAGFTWEMRHDIHTWDSWMRGDHYIRVRKYSPKPPDAVFIPASYRYECRIRIPLWAPFIAFLFVPAATVVTTRLIRHMRKRRGLCVKCAYNLTGNESGTCPECGTEIVP